MASLTTRSGRAWRQGKHGVHARGDRAALPIVNNHLGRITAAIINLSAAALPSLLHRFIICAACAPEFCVFMCSAPDQERSRRGADSAGSRFVDRSSFATHTGSTEQLRPVIQCTHLQVVSRITYSRNLEGPKSRMFSQGCTSRPSQLKVRSSRVACCAAWTATHGSKVWGRMSCIEHRFTRRKMSKKQNFMRRRH